MNKAPDEAPSGPYCDVDGVRDRFDRLAGIYESAAEQTKYMATRRMAARFALEADASGHCRQDILDLGCGTGLCGSAFRQFARRLVGVDLSARMLEIARSKGVYDALLLEDLLTCLSRGAGMYDVLTAAGVFAYVSDLGSVIAACHRSLRPGGILIFTVDLHSQAGADILPSPRSEMMYTYSRAYVERCLVEQDFTPIAVEEFDERLSWQDLTPVPALLVLARRRP